MVSAGTYSAYQTVRYNTDKRHNGQLYARRLWQTSRVIEFGLRLLLGLLQIVLAVQIKRSHIGYLFWFGVTMYVGATINMAALFHTPDTYRVLIQAPQMLMWLCLLVLTSGDLFRLLLSRTYIEERRALWGFSCWTACVLVGLGWIWRPENSFQALAIGVQYATLGTLISTITAWSIVAWRKPVDRLSRLTILHGWLWCGWLGLATVSAATCKGGLYWMVMPRLPAWYTTTRLSLLGCMCLLTSAYLLSLRKWTVVSQV